MAQSPRDPAPNPNTLAYSFAIFLSAFLLFQVQLIVGKYFLPWFGGTPAMWTTCMFFFQTLLLAGYVYSHNLARIPQVRNQGIFHVIVLIATLAILAVSALAWHVPLTPTSNWKPAGPEHPVWRLALLLAVSSGFPYLLLSTTGPLLQSWFAKTHPGGSPYRLYSLSNLGSFLALLSYPFIVEPWFPLKTQSWIWSAGFLFFAVFAGYCALRLGGTNIAGFPARTTDTSGNVKVPPNQPSVGTCIFWFSLSACGSLMFLATTNQICQNIAVVPMLWVVPLCIYLLSLVICFDRPGWYSRRVFQPALVIAILIAVFLLNGGALTRLISQIFCYSLILFVTCMVCHGELAQSKPAPRYLTQFYLMIAAGGALAGVFVALLAPHFFHSFWEYQIGLWLTVLLTFVASMRNQNSWLYTSRLGLPAIAVCVTLLPGAATLATHGRVGWNYLLLAGIVVMGVYVVTRSSKAGFDRARVQAAPWFVGVALAVLLSVLVLGEHSQLQGAVVRVRNFYGVLTIRELNHDRPGMEAYSLSHGRIPHGFQFRDAPRNTLATSYYGSNSGVEMALHALREDSSRVQPGGRNLRIGVIGLGVGTLAAYAKPGDYFRFYEINPDVIRIARDPKYFTYLNDCTATVNVVPGDARLSMERELRDRSSQQFNLLVLDAFSGDAVPTHLLTREAFDVYLNHLGTNGIIAAHITNTYLDLQPVLRQLAQEMGLRYRFIHSGGDNEITMYNDWVLLTRSSDVAGLDFSTKETAPTNFRTWTDDYSNLFRILR